MPETFFITTAIDYTNGAPHIGHAYEKILADVLARFRRLRGEEVFFLTGVDQHGQKVQQSAEKQAVAPQELVDGITAKFRGLWDTLGVQYDQWAATTDERHKRCVRQVLTRLWNETDPATGQSRWLYRKTEGGWYSVRQEQFLTDKERGADGEFGPEWQPVEFREEENFYFRLLPHKQWLLDLIDSRPDLIAPEFRRAELRNAVEKLEGDLCISRPAARLQWGIPLPEEFGAGFVTYVWFDALVNYISFAPGYDPAPGAVLGEFKRFWPALHVIGKDILIPAHGVYWLIMLKALGFSDAEMPRLLVHGWWNIRTASGGSEKMSKSLGNVVDPAELAGRFGAGALRYYLMGDMTTGRDADFSEERLIQRFNADLANSLGNLLNRTLNMARKYRNGVLCAAAPSPDGDAFTGPEGKAVDLAALRERAAQAVADYEREMAQHQVSQGLAAALQISAAGNELVEKSAPFKLAKSPEPADVERLDRVLYHLAEALRIVALLVSPVLPEAARAIFEQLDPEGKLPREFRLGDARWGGLADGHQLGAPVPVFPRIEVTPA